MSRRLYQEDSYRTRFRARVEDIFKHENRYGVVLDATLFYPESGGQPPDRGRLADLPILDVIELDNQIVHVAAHKPAFQVGEEVEGEIDWERRFVNMQQHTGQHILSQAFLRKLGARTVGSRLGTEHSTIDVDCLDLDWEQAAAVESLANRIVTENRRVKIYEAAQGEVKDLRVKKPLDREVLRIVEVEDFDKSPCGGTHCSRTGEVGLIKILRWEKVRNTSRIEFICGRLAEKDYFWKSRFIVELAQELTTKDTNIPNQIRNLIEENRGLRRQIETLRAELFSFQARDLERQIERIKDVEVLVAYLEDSDIEAIRAIAMDVTKSPRRIALLAAGRDRVHVIFSRSKDLDIDMRPLITAACQMLEGRGGGKPEVCQGGGRKAEATPKALEQARQHLIELLGT